MVRFVTEKMAVSGGDTAAFDATEVRPAQQDCRSVRIALLVYAAFAGRWASSQALMSAMTPSLPVSLKRSWKWPS